MTIRIPVPRGLVPNLLGLLGLIAVTLAIGGLAGNWWWSVLVGGVFAVGMAVLAQRQSEPAQATGAATAAVTQEIPRIPRVAAVG